MGDTPEDDGGLQKEKLQFRGIDGATSLKGEIVGRIPKLNDASTFRWARQLLQQLGGAVALRDELAFAGFVDSETGYLTTTSKPMNVFARLAAGKIHQPALAEEQKRLGDYRNKYLVVANRPESDNCWDSQDPLLIAKASMARRHRFLTTKNLHWQWFNMLTVGLVPHEHGGVDLDRAVKEVEQMRAAALAFARSCEGWSDQVGLYVNIFGHNNVNSLFIHILDMTQLGPAFGFHACKNCPLDDVLKVLREEAGGDKLSKVIRSCLPVAQAGLMRRKRTQGEANFCFVGVNGATSLKAELVGRVPVLKDAAAFREARRLLIEELGGAMTVSEELFRCGYLNIETGLLTTGTVPVNVFARIATGVMAQPDMDAEQAALGEFQEQFMICRNKTENDEHWDSQEPEWLGKQSMSRRHRFLTSKNTHWQWFNALVFGLVPTEAGGVTLAKACQHCRRMKSAALAYTSNIGGWSDKVGLYFHVFGHNSVNSLHMHIVDLAEVGPTFEHSKYKNCPVDAVIKVLTEELTSLFQSSSTSLLTSQASHTSLMTSSLAAIKKLTVTSSAMDSLARTMAVERRASQERAATVQKRDPNELIHLNIGGEVMVVPRETLLLTPKDSALHRAFREEWEGPLDYGGRVFLNYPPQSFQCIVNHLRLLHLTPSNQWLRPPEVPKDIQGEFRKLTWLLGVDDFLFDAPRAGAAKERDMRPRWKCER